MIDRSAVLEALEQVSGAEGFSEHDSLFEDGIGLDSMGFLELILELEALTGVDLRNDLDEPAVLSVGAFVEYVTNHIST
jgi:acyl carrier protein